MRDFFGGEEFYGIPCNATQKGEDPLGRIVHDYGYYPAGSYSVNATHSCTRVKYLSAKQVMQVLDGRLRGVDGQESHAAQKKCSKQGDPGVPVSKCVATVGCHNVSTGCQDVPGFA